MNLKRKGKSTWLMSYADLFTLLLTAFLLSVVLINEMENSLFLTIDTLLSQGQKYLDGDEAEQYIDLNSNGKFDEGFEEFIDCDPIEKVCFGDSGWKDGMGNGKYDPYFLDGQIDNNSDFLNIDIQTPISIKKGTKGLQITIPGDEFFNSGLAEINNKSKEQLCVVGKIVSDAIQFKYMQIPQYQDTTITYYTIDSLRLDLAKRCQRIVEKIRVEGHTDNTPISKRLAKQWYNQTNLRLSSARALSVVEFWSSNECNRYKLPIRLQEEWFTTVGIGEFSPIEDNRTKEGKRKNRRVEIFIDVDIEIDSTMIINEKMTCKEYMNREIVIKEEKSFYEKIFEKIGMK